MQQTNHPIDTERYSRQILLPEIGLEGQQRLHSTSALVIGAGGLGAPLLYYLTAAGLGHIGIVDDDQVGASNLQRQILFTEANLGLNKALQAAQRLKALNSSTQFEVYPYRLDDTCARTIAEQYDLLIDATDNLATRSLLDTVAEQIGRPYLYGAVEGFVGQCSLFHYAQAGRYRDLFGDFPSETSSSPIGIVGAVAGTLGSLMATEAIRVLATGQSALAGYLLRFDLRHMQFDRIQLA